MSFQRCISQSIVQLGLKKLNLVQQMQTCTTKLIYTLNTKSTLKTEARFGHALRQLAWKRTGTIPTAPGLHGAKATTTQEFVIYTKSAIRTEL